MTHRSRKPVAIIPASWKDRDPDRSLGTIVVGVDGSEESERALAWAVADASAWGASVEAVMVWSRPSVVLPAHLPLQGIATVEGQPAVRALCSENLSTRSMPRELRLHVPSWKGARPKLSSSGLRRPTFLWLVVAAEVEPARPYLVRKPRMHPPRAIPVVVVRSVDN